MFDENGGDGEPIIEDPIPVIGCLKMMYCTS